ncbi:MAG: acylaldehyde oxidase, partial [Rhizobacter sp.]|nr:acylaldehyde oxidase [Rhizobacter sp.]
MKRRRLLLTSAGVAGALVVGWGVLPPRSRLGHSGTLPKAMGDWGLNGWIRIAADQHISLAMPRSEMGQGVHTALAMMVAEELDVPLDRVRLVEAGDDRLYANVAAALSLLAPDDATGPSSRSELLPEGDAAAAEPDGEDEPPFDTRRWFVAKIASQLGISLTGGSSSTADGWSVVRLAAATARAQLLGAASLSWRLPVSELSIERGVISHPSGPRADYGVLARQASATPPGAVRLKDRSQWTLIGRAAHRLDAPARSNGSAVFGTDVRPPGLVFAAMRHGPMIGSSPGRVGVEAAMRLPGVERVVHLGIYGGSTPGLAVVARTSWHALQGARALDVDWTPPPGPRLQSASIEAELARRAQEAHASGEGRVFRSKGTPPAGDQAIAGDSRADAAGPGASPASAAGPPMAEASLQPASAILSVAANSQAASGARPGPRHLSARYSAPYLAHAAMEPINCTARVADGRVEIWAPTQVPTFARAMAAEVAGVDPSNVTLHVPYLGGSFGRRLEVDHVGQAVRVAMETGGRPVQLLWPREDDLRHDFYRPAAAASLSATLGDDGLPISLVATVACDALLPRFTERVMPALTTRFEWPDRSCSEGLSDLPYAIAH